ncbi:MAG: hypothetical protein K0S38_253 [Candidatus Paceibacter sp.]|jgi:site-specific recombinase XerC|nr:hypothetical protein [Candidatus Paceibacter sp.]
MPNLMAQFLEHRRNQETTVATEYVYKHVLELYARFLLGTEHFVLDENADDQILDLKVTQCTWIKARACLFHFHRVLRLSNKSIYNRVSVLRSFYKFLIEQRKVDANPFKYPKRRANVKV